MVTRNALKIRDVNATSFSQCTLFKAAINYLRMKNVSTYTSIVYNFAYAGSTNLVYAYKLFSKQNVLYF